MNENLCDKEAVDGRKKERESVSIEKSIRISYYLLFKRIKLNCLCAPHA